MKTNSRKKTSQIVLAVTFLLTVAATTAVAQVVNIPQRIIVKIRDDVSAEEREQSDRRILEAGTRRGTVLRESRRTATGASLIVLDQEIAGEELQELIQEIADTPNVEYAEEDSLLQPLFTPNDTRYYEQWHYFESTGGANLPSAWDVTTGSGINVAVLDTGYRPHVDLAANVFGGYDFISDVSNANDGNGRDSDPQDPGDWRTSSTCPNQPAQASTWHGTHVAGTVAAVTNNGTGVAGVAFGARVIPVRVLGRCGGSISDISDALVWAAGGSVSGVPANQYPARVINMSLGADGSCPFTLQSAIDFATAAGALIVVAAGNDNINAANTRPANCQRAFTVAATDRTGNKADYSNYGAVVDLAAPGGEIIPTVTNGVLSTSNTGTTTPSNDTYLHYQGTSMAAPHVSAIAALVLDLDPTFLGSTVGEILKGSARSFPGTCSQCGAGIVDATAAVSAVNNPSWTQITDYYGSVLSAASAYYQGGSYCEMYHCTYVLNKKYDLQEIVWQLSYACPWGTTTYPTANVNNGYRRVADSSGFGCVIEVMNVVFGQ